MIFNQKSKTKKTDLKTKKKLEKERKFPFHDL